MSDSAEGRRSFENGLDRAKDVFTTIGLVVSGMVFAAGLAGLLFVMIHVTRTDPPSFGSQGEWLYAAVAALVVAGWGFGQAVNFYARRRESVRTRDGGVRLPRIQIRRDGLSLEMSAPGPRSPDDERHTWTWSIDHAITPVKTLEITAAQLSAANLAARPGVDWDTVARHVNPEYPTLSPFEQKAYRDALQFSVEKMRGNR